MDWDTLHAQVPPFVPRIREDQSITKYFEDERDILGSESESVTSVDYSDCAPAHLADGEDDVPARVAAALPRIFAAGADVAGAASVAEAPAARAAAGRASAEEGSADGDGDARAALEWLARQDARALKALWEPPPPAGAAAGGRPGGGAGEGSGAGPAARAAAGTAADGGGEEGARQDLAGPEDVSHGDARAQEIRVHGVHLPKAALRQEGRRGGGGGEGGECGFGGECEAVRLDVRLEV